MLAFSFVTSWAHSTDRNGRASLIRWIFLHLCSTFAPVGSSRISTAQLGFRPLLVSTLYHFTSIWDPRRLTPARSALFPWCQGRSTGDRATRSTCTTCAGGTTAPCLWDGGQIAAVFSVIVIFSIRAHLFLVKAYQPLHPRIFFYCLLRTLFHTWLQRALHHCWKCLNILLGEQTFLEDLLWAFAI